MIFFLVCIIFSFTESAHAKDINESFTNISENLCKRTAREKGRLKEYKSLKVQDSKAEFLCAITAKSVLNNCAEDTLPFYKKFLDSKEKEMAATLTKSALRFCSNLADISSTEVVNLILETAVKDKISIDEAAMKVAEKAEKS